MWSKLSNAIGKSRTEESGHSIHQHTNNSSRSLASDASQSHHQDDTQRPPSPPSSPGKTKRLFKRMSRTVLNVPKHDDENSPHDDDDRPSGRSSPFEFKLPIGLPKRRKSHLHLGNGA